MESKGLVFQTLHSIFHVFKHQFTDLTAATVIKIGDFNPDEVVRSHYFSELKSLLHSKFREYAAFAFFDYEV